MNAKKKTLLPVVLFVLVGIVFVIVGILLFYQIKNLRARCTEETIGTVVENVRHETSVDSDSSYFPVVEYQVGDRTITQESRFGQYPPKYSVGEQVTVYYNPDNVTEYIIKDDSTSNIIGIFVIALGSIAVMVGLVIHFTNSSKYKNDKDASNEPSDT